MLDSLVRVSRRVGWVADRFATDPRRPRLTSPYQARGPRPLRSSETRVERARTARGRRTRQASSVRRRVHLDGLYALGAPEDPPSHLAAGLLTATEPVVALRAGESAPCRRRARQPAGSETDPCQPAATERWAEFPGRTLRIHPFASMRFHVLLNSLFKVLFNFPSRYLSAIGLVPVFSLRWSLPPALGCIPKQPDSKAARRERDQSRHGPDTRSG